MGAKGIFTQIEEDIVKSIRVVFFTIILAVLGFAATAHAQTATITCTCDDLNRVTNVSISKTVRILWTANCPW